MEKRNWSFVSEVALPMHTTEILWNQTLCLKASLENGSLERDLKNLYWSEATLFQTNESLLAILDELHSLSGKIPVSVQELTGNLCKKIEAVLDEKKSLQKHTGRIYFEKGGDSSVYFSTLPKYAAL